jgi:RNA polymerase sigma factor (sigma-70 family)
VGVSQRPETKSAFDDAVVRLEHAGRIYLRRHRLPLEDAEDILQQILLVFLIKQGEIHLLTVVDSSLLESLAPPTSPDPLERRDLQRALGRALAGIPPRCRVLLQLRYGQDCDPQEAAAQLGYRPSGAYKIFERCLAALTRGLVATGFMKERREEP